MKKILSVIGIAVGITAFLAVTLVAAAQTATVTTTQPMLLQVNRAGKTLLRGTIASVASGTMTVNGWGGTWTVNVPTSAEILPAAVNKDITQFKTGDFVGISGTMSQSASWTIDAAVVRDWTYRQAISQEQKQNAQNARTTMKGGLPRDYVGTASNVSGDTFTLTASNGTAYTVNVASGAEVVSRGWATLSLANIANGNTVRVWGVNASGTIAAKIVRDTTLPTKTTTQ